MPWEDIAGDSLGGEKANKKPGTPMLQGHDFQEKAVSLYPRIHFFKI